MINFTKEGIYGDKNMPPITEFKAMPWGYGYLQHLIYHLLLR
jgi:hypothetical protein